LAKISAGKVADALLAAINVARDGVDHGSGEPEKFSDPFVDLDDEPVCFDAERPIWLPRGQ
jgi:hypothetical protein